jgi:hypothetical protein
MGAGCCYNNDGNNTDCGRSEAVLEQQPAIPVEEVVKTEQAAPRETVVPEQEKPSPPLSAAELVRFVLVTADGEKSVDVKRRPLGLWFTKSVPMKVARVAKEFAGAAAGIEEGWTMISVNGEEISKPPMDYEAALGILNKHVKKLLEDTSNVVDLVFTCSDGKDVTFKVQWSPLGTAFSNQQMPITVTDAGLYGGLLGIKPGMVFKSVSGVDVSECGSYDDAMLVLKKNMDLLPQLPRGTDIIARERPRR